MSTDQDLKTELDKLKKENYELRKKLESRDVPFNKQLNSRVDTKFFDLTFNVGAAIASSAGQELISALKNKKIIINYQHNTYGKSGYYINILDDKDVKSVKDYIAELELKKFQESLDNFSWAVNNQGQ
jgi:hypothetical protein